LRPEGSEGQDTPVGIRETRYAWNGDVSPACQVVGDGPEDVIFVMGRSSHIDAMWSEPSLSSLLKGIPDRWRLHRVVG
jgi:hypothetical protein